MPEVKVQSLAPDNSRGRSLSRYAVEVDGKRVGIVGQHRVADVRPYANQMYGYHAERTRWFWEADEPLGGGDYEFTSRKEAVDDLVGYVVSLSGNSLL